MSDMTEAFIVCMRDDFSGLWRGFAETNRLTREQNDVGDRVAGLKAAAFVVATGAMDGVKLPPFIEMLAMMAVDHIDWHRVIEALEEVPE